MNAAYLSRYVTVYLHIIECCHSTPAPAPRSLKLSLRMRSVARVPGDWRQMQTTQSRRDTQTLRPTWSVLIW